MAQFTSAAANMDHPFMIIHRDSRQHISFRLQNIFRFKLKFSITIENGVSERITFYFAILWLSRTIMALWIELRYTPRFDNQVKLPDLLQELQLRHIWNKWCGITVHVGRYIYLLLAVIYKYPGSAPYVISALRGSITTRTAIYISDPVNWHLWQQLMKS